MASWVEAARFDDLKRRRKLAVTIGDREIALFWHNEQAYALENRCIHRQRELSRGVILRDRVVCPGHQWAFDLATGYEQQKERCQPTYAVRVEDGSVEVDLESRTADDAEASEAGEEVG